MTHRSWKVAAGLVFVATAAFQAAPSYREVARSARVFRENMQSLESVRTNLNPIEKVVFSLMLGDSGECVDERGAALRRTS